jgi:putative tryptophan/tyrosine transport system substrate-binding protein
MRRRDFIAGIVVSATMRRAHAQQTAKVYRIAMASPSEPVGDLTENGTRGYRAFFQRLRELGYVEGQNLVIERYSGEGRTENNAELAGEVVRSNPDLIFVSQYRLARNFKVATGTIPIVGSGGDPTAYGVVSSLARPGGNITGVTTDAGVHGGGKSLELLREMVPLASRVGTLTSRANVETPYTAAIQEVARRLKISVVGPPLDPPFQEQEYRRVFAAIAQAGADALLVGTQVENIMNRHLIVELAAKYRLPAIYGWREFVDIGGLMAYGVEVQDVYRHAADQVDQIVKGAKPGDIPIYQPTKFELTINSKTAKALGLTIPFSLLARADEVIE